VRRESRQAKLAHRIGKIALEDEALVRTLASRLATQAQGELTAPSADSADSVVDPYIAWLALTYCDLTVITLCIWIPSTIIYSLDPIIKGSSIRWSTPARAQHTLSR
jgi:hypothetical protein